jgi:hypothetical protein
VGAIEFQWEKQLLIILRERQEKLNERILLKASLCEGSFYFLTIRFSGYLLLLLFFLVSGPTFHRYAHLK